MSGEPSMFEQFLAAALGRSAAQMAAAQPPAVPQPVTPPRIAFGKWVERWEPGRAAQRRERQLRGLGAFEMRRRAVPASTWVDAPGAKGELVELSYKLPRGVRAPYLPEATASARLVRSVGDE